VISSLRPASPYYYGARAGNAGGTSWSAETERFTTLPLAPQIDSLAAVAIEANSVTLGAQVVMTGGEDPGVTLYFGITDGGSDAGSWQSNVTLGIIGQSQSAVVSGLNEGVTYSFRARAVNRAGESWAPASGSFTTLAATGPGVVINEVHYDADPKTEAAEFVELHNAGDLSVDLSDWTLAGLGGFVFPAGTSIDPGGYLVVAEEASTMPSKFGVLTSLEYSGNLRADGDDLRLLDELGTEMDRVNYQAGFPWPVAARGQGASMELLHPELDNDLGGSWRSSGAGPALPPVTYLPSGSSAILGHTRLKMFGRRPARLRLPFRSALFVRGERIGCV
jgi:hypothetical protein